MPHLLAHRRDVAVVEDLDAIDLLVDVGGRESVGDGQASEKAGRSVNPVQASARSRLRKRSDDSPRRPDAYQTASVPSLRSSTAAGFPRG